MSDRQTQTTDCRGCLDRFPGCHGSCERYAAYRQRLEAEKAEDLKRRELERLPGYGAEISERWDGNGRRNRKNTGGQRARFKNYT